MKTKAKKKSVSTKPRVKQGAKKKGMQESHARWPVRLPIAEREVLGPNEKRTFLIDVTETLRDGRRFAKTPEFWKRRRDLGAVDVQFEQLDDKENGYPVEVKVHNKNKVPVQLFPGMRLGDFWVIRGQNHDLNEI